MGGHAARRVSMARRAGVAALVASLLAMLVPVLVPAAQAALPSRIVGYAEDASGARLAGITVEVYSSSTFPGPLDSVTTDGSGEFAFDVTDTPAGGGGYVVAFTDPNDALGYLAFNEIYIQPGYDEIIGAIMRPGGRVAGTVSYEGGGSVAGLCARIEQYYTGYAPDVPSAVDCDLSDGYESPALASAAYNVTITEADGTYVAGQFVDLVAPATVVRDFVLPAPDSVATARVSGQILASDGGAPLGGCVSFFDQDDVFVTNVCTDESNSFRTGFIEPGTYRISGFSYSFFYTVQELTDYPIVAGDQTIELATTKAATIEGTVTAPGGTPIEGAQVRACAVSSPFNCGFARATTGADGTYVVSAQALVGQNVAVAFTGPNLVWEWHNDIVFSSADGFAPPVGATTVVPVAATVTTVDAELGSITPSAISGTITDSMTDLPLGGVAVTIARPVAPGGFPGLSPEWFTGTVTAPDGTYTVGNLEAGDYLVRAATFGYQTERYDDLRNGPGEPLVVTVGASATASGIDFDLDPQGVIEGRVTTDLDPISPYVTDFCVKATPDSGLFPPVSTCRQLGTTYRISKLPSDTYTLEITSDDYVTQTITGVVVATPNTTVQNVALERLPVLSGTVTDDATPANPVQATVCTENADFTLVRCATSAADGTYELTVRPGTLGVRAEAMEYFTEWYLNSSTAPGTPIVVGASDVGNVDFTLERRPSISGQVSFDGQGVCTQVTLFDAATDNFVTSTFASCSTGSTRGSYKIFASPGDYKVRFGSSFDPTYQFQYWDSQSDISLADVVELDPGEAITGIDAVLLQTPKISGVVTEDVTGDPIANATVIASANGFNFVASTNAAGE